MLGPPGSLAAQLGRVKPLKKVAKSKTSRRKSLNTSRSEADKESFHGKQKDGVEPGEIDLINGAIHESANKRRSYEEKLKELGMDEGLANFGNMSASESEDLLGDLSDFDDQINLQMADL